MKTFRDFGIFVPANATGEIRTTCPACTPTRRHKNEKDLGVNVEKGVWTCFHCKWEGGLGGDKTERPIPHVRPNFNRTDLPEQIVNYLVGRGILQQTLIDNQISSENGVIQFPYFKGGECVALKFRTMDKKFWQSKNPEPCLYRFDDLSPELPVTICEGEFDALSFCEVGIKNATSVPNGAPALNAKNYEKEFVYLASAATLFEMCDKVILAVDNDEPGKKLEQELVRRIGVEKCWRIVWPEGCKDANDVLVKLGPHALKNCWERAKPYPVEGIYTSGDIEDLILHLYDQGDRRGSTTGWPLLDRYYTVKAGQVTVVTGIPGSGKSAWLDALLVNLAVKESWTFAVFSPENWPIERHAQSLIEKLSRLPFHGGGKITREGLQEMIDTINERFFFLMPEDDKMTVDAILESARVTIFRSGVKGLVIDPWNELTHIYGQLTETQYISETLGRIRRFARRNNCHVWVVAHPQKLVKDHKTGKYKMPTMYEISGGANWRNKADVGICVHRPDMGDDVTEIYVQKVRFREVGRLGGVRFRYARETGNYTDVGSIGLAGDTCSND